MRPVKINDDLKTNLEKYIIKYKDVLDKFFSKSKIFSDNEIKLLQKILFYELEHSYKKNIDDLDQLYTSLNDLKKNVELVEPIYSFIEKNLNPDSIIFEIGVHIGKDSIKLRELTNSNFIYGFEPDPRNVRILEKRNRLKLFKEFHQCAISNEVGEFDFYLSSGHPPEVYNDPDMNEEWSASNSLRQPKDHLTLHQWCKFDTSIKVPTTRLDFFCESRQIDNIDFVWMDVQGAEDLVIDGFGNLKNKIQYIYTEYSTEQLYENSPTLEKILEMLGENWQIIELYQTDVLLKNITFSYGNI